MLEVAIKGGWVDDKTGKYIVREMRHIVQTTTEPRWRIAAAKVIMAAANVDARRESGKKEPGTQVNVNITNNVIELANRLAAQRLAIGGSDGVNSQGLDTAHTDSKTNGVPPK